MVCAEIIQVACAADAPSEPYKRRIIVRNQDFLRAKLARFHRADWQAGGWFYRAVSFLFIKYCGYAFERGAACIFEVKRHTLVIVLHARPLGGVVLLILVEMCMVITTSVSNAFSDKLFAGKLVNRCQVLAIVSVVPAKGVDLLLPFAVIFYIILEGKPIKPARRIICGIQRDAENLVTIVCRSAKRHVLGYGVFIVTGAYILREETDSAIFISFLVSYGIVSAVVLKIDGCRSRDKALRCFARFRNRGRFARAIVGGKIVRQHQGFLVRVGRILCRGFLVRVGCIPGQNGFFLVLGIA